MRRPAAAGCASFAAGDLSFSDYGLLLGASDDAHLHLAQDASFASSGGGSDGSGLTSLTGQRHHAPQRPYRNPDVPPLYNLPGSIAPPARLRLVERPKASAAAAATSTAAKAAAAATFSRRRTSPLRSGALVPQLETQGGGTNVGKLEASSAAKSWGGSRRTPSPTNKRIGATLLSQTAAAEHAAAAIIPAGVQTGTDAVRHFASGAGRKGEALFCNVAAAAAAADHTHTEPHHKQDRGGAAASLGSGISSTTTISSSSNVYDLVVVPQRRADAALHFVVSYGGVVEMRWVALSI